jgi:hypothetical protein
MRCRFRESSCLTAGSTAIRSTWSRRKFSARSFIATYRRPRSGATTPSTPVRFEARRGQPIGVRWMNNLPNHHMFPIDNTKHGVKGEPAVRTVVHLHGHKVLPESDGYPEAWFANNFERTGPFFELRTYRYPNDQAATQLWYHDPALCAAQQLRRALGRLSAARSRRGRPESSRRAVRDPAGDPGPVLQP